MRQLRSGHVYIFRVHDMPYFKVGVAGPGRENVNSRLNQVRIGCPFLIYPEAVYLVDWPFLVEQQAHQMFPAQRMRGEWFNLSNESLHTLKRYLEPISTPCLCCTHCRGEYVFDPERFKNYPT